MVFVATTLATFAFFATIVYIMGGPKTAAPRMVTNSMQQPWVQGLGPAAQILDGFT